MDYLSCRAAERPAAPASGRLTGFAAALLATAALVAVAALLPGAARAQDATWLASPATADFNTALNWSPAAVPTGTAFFGTSNTTALTFSTNTSIGGWTFNPGASAYSFTNFTNGRTLTFTGAGIVINGGSASITYGNGALNRANLFFFNASTAGSATITNAAGVLGFNDNSTAGSARITNGSSGCVVPALFTCSFLNFNDNSTAGNASITNTQTINFAANSTAGGATITNAAGILGFNANSTAGNASITNSGNLFFSDNSTAGNASITNGGILAFNANSTAGNANITNAGGTLVFNANSTAGSANITNTSTVDFSPSSGPLGNNKLSAGSIAGSGSFLLGRNELTVGGNNLSTTVSGIIADGGVGGGTGGSLVKVGTGTLILSHFSTYTGATNVNAGFLEVDDSIASSLTTVNNGATLMGTGAVGNTTINNGGTLLAGTVGTPGTLTVNGSLMMSSAAAYVVFGNPTSISRTVVSGAASISGTAFINLASTGGYHAGTFTILMANGGVTGTFSTVNISGTLGPLVRNPHLAYDAHDVFLVLDPGTISPSLPPGASRNVVNVAAGIDKAILGGATPTAGFNTLLSLTGAPLTAALTQASGETATGSQQTTFNAMTQFLGLLLDPFIDGRGAPAAPPSGATPYAEADSLAYASRNRTSAERDAYAMFTKAPLAQNYDPHWRVWAAGFGGAQTTDGNTAQGSNNTTSRIFGMAAGADYIFSPRTIAGFALAGGGTNFSVANGGPGRSDLFQAGAFIRHTVGAAYISGALAYGWQDITTNRTVTIAGIDQLQARFNANAFSGRVEGGYRFVTPWIGGIGITPYAAAQFTTFDLPAYAEQVLSGANTFALAYGPKSVTDTRSELGLRSDKSFAMPNGVLTLRGRLAWAHDYNPDRSIGATFQSLPGASFTVGGAAQAADAALTSVSIERKWINGWSAAATFEGEFSNVTASYAGKAVVRYAW
jgi:autotransporter-associated beta strand protein